MAQAVTNTYEIIISSLTGELTKLLFQADTIESATAMAQEYIKQQQPVIVAATKIKGVQHPV